MNGRICAVLAALMLAPVVGGAAFLKYDGVDGESTSAADPGNELQSLTWTWSMHRDADGTAHYSDVTLKRGVDASSAQLAEAAASGKSLGRAQIGTTAADGSSVILHLENARVSAYSTESDGTEVVEEVSFSYNKISWEYKPQSSGRAAPLSDVIVFTGLE